MKVLQLCLRVPFPARDGGTLAMKSLADGVQLAGHDLSIFALNTSKHFIHDDVLKDYRPRYNIHTAYIDNRINFKNAFLNLLSGEAFHVSRFFNADAERELINLLKISVFDVVVFESIFTAPYLEAVKKYSRAKLVLRSHNVEYRIWERLAKREKPIKKQYLLEQVQRLKKFEMAKLKEFDLLAAISTTDEKLYRKLGFEGNLSTINFGVNPEEAHAKPVKKGEFHIGFLGSMDWIPNQEGVEWFLEECWPTLSTRFPNLILHLAGRHMSDKLLSKHDGKQLFVEGSIHNAKAFLRKLDMSLAPLLSGSGVRIKVLEAMSLGLPVAATPVGYEGIAAKPGKEIIEFGSCTELQAQLAELMNNPEKLNELVEASQAFIERHYNKKAAAEKLFEQLKFTKE